MKITFTFPAPAAYQFQSERKTKVNYQLNGFKFKVILASNATEFLVRQNVFLSSVMSTLRCFAIARCISQSHFRQDCIVS